MQGFGHLKKNNGFLIKCLVVKNFVIHESSGSFKSHEAVSLLIMLHTTSSWMLSHIAFKPCYLISSHSSSSRHLRFFIKSLDQTMLYEEIFYYMLPQPENILLIERLNFIFDTFKFLLPLWMNPRNLDAPILIVFERKKSWCSK